MNDGMVHHPRAESLHNREKLIDGFRAGIVAEGGLMAHGRGETFDYLLGEKTSSHAMRAIEVSAATLLLAARPVISVNGNAAALQAGNMVKLAKIVNAGIEVNLYYRSASRENAIKLLLESAGAEHVLGMESATARLEGISSERRRIDPGGIAAADVVLVPLEDGDRTEALVKAGKRVIAIDLNPLSRTARTASITIVDNIVRAVPALMEATRALKMTSTDQLEAKLSSFDNNKNLNEATKAIHQHLLLVANRLEIANIDGPPNRPLNQRADSLNQLHKRKNGSKIIVLTAYDFQTARIIDETGIDIILVGDSLGMVFQGATNTKAVSMEQMLYHAEIVSRASQKTPVIADMPAHSYENEQETLTNAKMLLDVGVDGVKIEGYKPAAIKILVSKKIPVIGHIGLLPQTADRYSVRGRDMNEANQIFNDAIALDDSGVIAIILESITEELSKRITENIKTPTIGIGAGKFCDGQILVTSDLLGLTRTPTPRYVKKYVKLDESIQNAISQFKLDVAQGTYPDREHSYY